MASVEELDTRKDEIESRLKDIGAEFSTQDMTDEVRTEWNELNKEVETIQASLTERAAVMARLEELANQPENVEPAQAPAATRGKRVTSHVPDDPTRIEEYRKNTNSMDDLDQAYRDGAMKIVERMRSVHPDMSRETMQDNVARMLDTVDERPGEDGPRSLARRVIQTSSTGYSKEFGTYLRTGGRIVGKEMERAASLTTTAGGFAVPVVLDPTVILVSAGVTNPVRSISRVVHTTGNTWEGISSTGITAAYSDEVTETSDNAPTLAQPTANLEKAQAFVPFSIEIGEDWANFQGEMAMMFQDAKDTLENTQFLTGLGHTAHVPQGLIAVGGNTAVVSTATTAVIAAADIYSLEAALSERWLRRAQIVGSRAFFQKVRQLDTAGGANLWVQLADGNPGQLLGYPSHVWSAYSSATTTSGSTVATIGDFNQFLIAEKVGLSVELIPHMFATGNNRPSGQRGLYMYWRNTSKPLTPGLTANSAFVSLKVL